MKKALFFFLLVCAQLTGFSQEENTYELKNVIFKPTLGVGVGMMNYYGDISRNNRTNNPLISDIGYDFRVSFPLYRGFDINFNVLTGNVSANEITTTRNINFRSKIFSGGISAAYNFDHFLPANRKIEPFVSLGVELVEYLSKTDLYDGYGNLYYYWDDGTIRNLPNLPENELISTRLSRDYVYETDIRKANVDGFGNYPEQTLGIPVGAGANMFITDKLSLRVGATMHILFNDYLDGITPKSVGVRKGKSGNDMFLYSFASLSYNLSNAPNSYLGLSCKDLKALDLGDEDDDGVIDLKDECPQTPYGAPIDKVGCPLDSDKDGVPDYKDLEENTPDSAIVDSLGRAMNNEQLQEVAKLYNDSTSGEYQDTSFAMELTDKTRRNNKGGNTNQGGIPVGPSTGNQLDGSIAQGGNTAKPIEGLNVPTPECYDGVVYRVQIMATKAKPAKNPYPSITDLVGSDFGDGYYRFFTGEYNSKPEADTKRNSLKTQGFKDPFLRVFQDCKLLPMGAVPTGKPASIKPKSGGSSSGALNKPIDGINVPEPKCDGNGPIYRVQIMATKVKPKTNPYPNISDLSGTYFGDGNYKFFVGNYATKAEALSRIAELKSQGFKGPFVRVFENCDILPAGTYPEGKSSGSNSLTPVKNTPTNKTSNSSNTAKSGNATSTPLPAGNFNLPPTMDEAKFKFRVLLAEFDGSAPTSAISNFENYGPVDSKSINGKNYLFMGEFPKLDMAKRFQKELEAEGLNKLSISGEYDGKILSTEEFNLLFE